MRFMHFSPLPCPTISSWLNHYNSPGTGLMSPVSPLSFLNCRVVLLTPKPDASPLPQTFRWLLREKAGTPVMTSKVPTPSSPLPATLPLSHSPGTMLASVLLRVPFHSCRGAFPEMFFLILYGSISHFLQICFQISLLSKAFHGYSLYFHLCTPHLLSLLFFYHHLAQFIYLLSISPTRRQDP